MSNIPIWMFFFIIHVLSNNTNNYFKKSDHLGIIDTTNPWLIDWHFTITFRHPFPYFGHMFGRNLWVSSNPYAMLFYYASTPTCGNWFQTIQLKHKSDDHAGDAVISVSVTNETDTALQLQIWSTFVTVLWCSKIEITDGTGIIDQERYNFET